MALDHGGAASGFTLGDAAQAQRLSLTDALEHGPVVVSFYKTSCRASKVAFPFLERLRQAYPEERVAVWGISLDSPNVTSSFMRRYEITFPNLVDNDGYPIAQAYGVTETPTTFLIDQGGTIVWQSEGFEKSAMETLSAKVAYLLDLPAANVAANMDDIPDRVPG